MQWHRSLATSLVVAGLAGCGDDPNRPPSLTGSVRGTVTQVETGAPVAGARLVLVDPATIATRRPFARTNLIGRYRIDDVEPGTYAVFVFHDTLLIYQRSGPLAEVAAGAITIHNVSLLDSFLDDAGYRVEGNILDAETREPILGAYVEGALWGYSDIPSLFQGYGPPSWDVTDENGFFSVRVAVFTDEQGGARGLEPISATKSGYRPGTLVGTGPSDPPFYPSLLPLPADLDSVLTVVLRLEPEEATGVDPTATGALRGTARFLGEPIAGLPVAASLLFVSDPDTLRVPTAWTSVPVPDRTTVTDPEGRFLIAGLSPGSYVVHPGYQDGDGYLLELVEAFSVVAAETTEVFLPSLQRGIRPLAPADGTMITDPTPEFRWEARPAEPGYSFTGYRLRYATSHLDWTTVGPLEAESWQLPEAQPLRAGSSVRWLVEVLGTVEGEPNVVLARFEHLATFQIAR